MTLLARLKQKLFRWESDGTAPFRLSQRRIFIIPTRAGMIFALTLAAMFTGAINYTLALGHALVFLLCGLGLIGMVHTFRNLFGLEISAGRSHSVFVGETAYFTMIFSNQRTTPRLGLTLQAEGNGLIDAEVAAQSKSNIAVPVNALQRGWLKLPRVRLATVYPLGLLYAWAYLQPEMRCLIYPRPIYSPLPPEQSADRSGEHHGAAGQEDFAGFRHRQPADSQRHIAWKASAKGDAQQALLVKQFAGGATQALQLDWQLTPDSSDVETRLGILAGWVLAADAAGMTYGLRLPGHEISIQRGEPHRRLCLEALARYPA